MHINTRNPIQFKRLNQHSKLKITEEENQLCKIKDGSDHEGSFRAENTENDANNATLEQI